MCCNMHARGTCDRSCVVQGAFKLTNFQDGCLPAAFMVGLVVASPTFAALAKRFQPFKLVGSGLLTWTIAVAACAATWDFWSILCCRMLVGVGEASFVVFAAPFIGAPPFKPVRMVCWQSTSLASGGRVAARHRANYSRLSYRVSPHLPGQCASGERHPRGSCWSRPQMRTHACIAMRAVPTGPAPLGEPPRPTAKASQRVQMSMRRLR